jgi:hypothetical protein
MQRPDGSRIAYAVYPEDGDSSKASLWVMNADGSRLSAVPVLANTADPAWRPRWDRSGPTGARRP